MKKLDTSAISTVVQMPVKSGTWIHLQDAYTEAIAEGIKNLIGNDYGSGIVYILSGCVNSGTGSNYIISAGAVFYNGEVYQVDAATFTLGGGQAAVASIVTTFYTNGVKADPVTFSDGTPRSIHQIRKVAIAAATPGTGIADFIGFRPTNMQMMNTQGGVMPGSLSVKFTQDESVFYSSGPVDTVISFDMTNARPGVVKRIKWAYGTGRTLTLSATGSQALVKDSGDTTAAANATNILYLLYVGKNETGKDEISYSIKQL